jgi:hypothetical protein
MIPSFEESGNLPPGFHAGTPEEIADRFGLGSADRKVETQEILDFIDWARQAGVRRLLVGGSYVTQAISPNDVDLLILPGPGFPRIQPPGNSGDLRWPFLHIMVATDEADFEAWASRIFCIDRNQHLKGAVEVIL